MASDNKYEQYPTGALDELRTYTTTKYMEVQKQIQELLKGVEDNPTTRSKLEQAFPDISRIQGAFEKHGFDLAHGGFSSQEFMQAHRSYSRLVKLAKESRVGTRTLAQYVEENWFDRYDNAFDALGKAEKEFKGEIGEDGQYNYYNGLLSFVYDVILSDSKSLAKTLDKAKNDIPTLFDTMEGTDDRGENEEEQTKQKEEEDEKKEAPPESVKLPKGSMSTIDKAIDAHGHYQALKDAFGYLLPARVSANYPKYMKVDSSGMNEKAEAKFRPIWDAFLDKNKASLDAADRLIKENADKSLGISLGDLARVYRKDTGMKQNPWKGFVTALVNSGNKLALPGEGRGMLDKYLGMLNSPAKYARESKELVAETIREEEESDQLKKENYLDIVLRNMGRSVSNVKNKILKDKINAAREEDKRTNSTDSTTSLMQDELKVLNKRGDKDSEGKVRDIHVKIQRALRDKNSSLALNVKYLEEVLELPASPEETQEALDKAVESKGEESLNISESPAKDHKGILDLLNVFKEELEKSSKDEGTTKRVVNALNPAIKRIVQRLAKEEKEQAISKKQLESLVTFLGSNIKKLSTVYRTKPLDGIARLKSFISRIKQEALQGPIQEAYKDVLDTLLSSIVSSLKGAEEKRKSGKALENLLKSNSAILEHIKEVAEEIESKLPEDVADTIRKKIAEVGSTLSLSMPLEQAKKIVEDTRAIVEGIEGIADDVDELPQEIPRGQFSRGGEAEVEDPYAFEEDLEHLYTIGKKSLRDLRRHPHEGITEKQVVSMEKRWDSLLEGTDDPRSIVLGDRVKGKVYKDLAEARRVLALRPKQWKALEDASSKDLAKDHFNAINRAYTAIKKALPKTTSQVVTMKQSVDKGVLSRVLLAFSKNADTKTYEVKVPEDGSIITREGIEADSEKHALAMAVADHMERSRSLTLPTMYKPYGEVFPKAKKGLAIWNIQQSGKFSVKEVPASASKQKGEESKSQSFKDQVTPGQAVKVLREQRKLEKQKEQDMQGDLFK